LSDLLITDGWFYLGLLLPFRMLLIFEIDEKLLTALPLSINGWDSLVICL